MRLALAALVTVAGCVTPLSNRIDVGNEAFIVVVGEGAGGIVDLFAAPAEGGMFRQLTFTRSVEDLPRLGPTGTLLAFVRGDTPVILDLITGLETDKPWPEGAGAIEGFGWNAAGDTVVARAGNGIWWSPTGTAAGWTAVPAEQRDAAADLTREQVGAPGFGFLGRCEDGGEWCIVTAGGETAIDPAARDPIRWGPDAIAYLARDRIEIRPLGGGRIRQPTWAAAPAGIRHPTHHPGTGAAAR